MKYLYSSILHISLFHGYSFSTFFRTQVPSTTIESSAKPEIVKSLRDKNTPLRVACGYSHMAAVTTNGQIFVWGDGKYGQLGLGSRVKQR